MKLNAGNGKPKSGRGGKTRDVAQINNPGPPAPAGNTCPNCHRVSGSQIGLTSHLRTQTCPWMTIILDYEGLPMNDDRKLTHTDRLPDQSSCNPTSNKATTIKILTRRAQLLSDSPGSLPEEARLLKRVFQKNNYTCSYMTSNETYIPQNNRHIARPITETFMF